MKHLLSSSAFLVVNKQLAKVLGLKETVLLADLISKEEYFIANGMTDGWFFNTEKNIEQDTTLTSFQQRKCLKALKKYGIIETKRIGIPAKQHFKINEQVVIKFLNNLSSSKSTTINKNKEIKTNNNISNKMEKHTWVEFKKKVFGLEVSEISAELQMPIEMANDFLNYWSETTKSKTKMRYELQKTWNTKLRLKTWEKNSKKWDKPKGTSKLDAQINEWQKAKKLL
jgi:hypothetical protein